MRIEPVAEKLPAEFDLLRAEARAEGHHFLDRLANDWSSGAMRFSQPGEAFIAAYSGDRLAGVGGLTVDPAMPGALRMRWFYVRQSFRRSGVARSIARMLPEMAFKTTTVVALNAAPDSVPFWESLGFMPDQEAGHTHICGETDSNENRSVCRGGPANRMHGETRLNQQRRSSSRSSLRRLSRWYSAIVPDMTINARTIEIATQ
jgi:GNAT superfamily N-acetyltransferase